MTFKPIYFKELLYIQFSLATNLKIQTSITILGMASSRVIVIKTLGLNAWPRRPWMQQDYGRHNLHNCPALVGTHMGYVALDLRAHQMLVCIIITLTHIVCSMCWPHPIGPDIGNTHQLLSIREAQTWPSHAQ